MSGNWGQARAARDAQLIRWAEQGAWIGVDFDGTLADSRTGQPIESMVARVKHWRLYEVEVRVFTARASSAEGRAHVEAFCLTHLGEKLPVTDRKDYAMVESWDDRAVQVVPDSGMRVDGTVETDAIPRGVRVVASARSPFEEAGVKPTQTGGPRHAAPAGEQDTAGRKP